MMLGNLTIGQMEHRLGITFPDELKTWMNENHQDKAEGVAAGKWHCFDMPFTVVCGDKKTAELFRDQLSPLADKMTDQINIAWVNE